MDQTPGEKLVNSVILTLIARAVIIVGIPMASWMTIRAVTSIDTMKDQAFETNTTVKLIQQTQTSQTQIIADHEVRIRAVESLNRNNSRN